MAEADRDPTSPFAIPPPVRITLPEAVDLIAGEGLDPDAVWNALCVALSDGRLSAGDCRPEYFRSLPYEQLALRRMPQVDLDAIRYFGEIPSGSWRRWIAEDGSIARSTGEVLRHIPDRGGLIIFQPTLSRNSVLVHFMAATKSAPVQPAPPKLVVGEIRYQYTVPLAPPKLTTPVQPALPKLKLEPAGDGDIREVLKVVYNGYPDGEGPNISAVVTLVKSQLEARDLEATKERIQHIAEESEFKKKRRVPGKHRE